MQDILDLIIQIRKEIELIIVHISIEYAKGHLKKIESYKNNLGAYPITKYEKIVK